MFSSLDILFGFLHFYNDFFVIRIHSNIMLILKMRFVTVFSVIAISLVDYSNASFQATSAQHVPHPRREIPSPSTDCAGGLPKHSTESSGQVGSLDKRNLVICPEETGAQALPCSAPICGGENPENKGFCVNKNAGGSNCHCGIKAFG